MKNPWIKEEKKDTYEIRQEQHHCYKSEFVGCACTTEIGKAEIKGNHSWIMGKGQVWIANALVVAKSTGQPAVGVGVWEIKGVFSRDFEGNARQTGTQTVTTISTLNETHHWYNKRGRIDSSH